MKNEPKRHHYIPKFILRNFSDDGEYLFYFDKAKNEQAYVNIKDIFMCKNLYRDEINSSDNPVQIENDLARYENEICQLLSTKIQDKNDIVLTVDEDERLKLFLAILAYRSVNTGRLFSKGLSSESKNLYSIW